MSSCHHVIMSSCHHVIMSSCHQVIKLSCHHVIMSSCHHVIISCATHGRTERGRKEVRKEGSKGRQEGERDRRITKCFTGNIFASNHFTNIVYSNYLSFGIEGLRNFTNMSIFLIYLNSFFSFIVLPVSTSLVTHLTRKEPI